MNCLTAQRLAGAALLIMSGVGPCALANTQSPIWLEARTAPPALLPGWVAGPAADRTSTSNRSGVPAQANTSVSIISSPLDMTTISMASAVAKADVPGSQRPGSPVSIGVSAAARSIATSSGRANATARAEWHVLVVINPFASAGPVFGQAMYQRLLDRFGCDGVGRCPTFVDFTTAFQHQTTGNFLHSVQPFHEGIASFSESVTIRGMSGPVRESASFAGSAVYNVRQSPGSNNLVGEVVPSGDWTDGDFDLIGPAAIPANLPAPMLDTGPIGGERLFALRQASLNSGFELSFPISGGILLPVTTFRIDIEQAAGASFLGGYGWGSVAADFDDTALTSVMSLVDPLGEFDFDPSILQVYVTPVPEPSTLLLWAAGLGLLMLGWARRRPGGAAAGD